MKTHDLPQCHRRLLSLLLLLPAIALLAASAPTKTLTGKVVKTADGDTLTLLVGEPWVEVRPTPERAQPFPLGLGKHWLRGASAFGY